MNSKILLGVPYYSQWLDVKDSDWQRRSCGVAALKMAMEFVQNFSLRHPSSPASIGGAGKLDLDDLIKKGVALGAYKSGTGWIHEGLVLLAKECGFQKSFRKEWVAGKSAEGINFIIDIISQNIPVLASVKSDSGGHLILLVGFSAEGGSASGGEKEGENIKGFYYHDPDAKKASDGKNKYILKKDFLELWKGRAVVVKK